MNYLILYMVVMYIATVFALRYLNSNEGSAGLGTSLMFWIFSPIMGIPLVIMYLLALMEEYNILSSIEKFLNKVFKS